MQIMATSNTQFFSSAKNWKKEWRTSKSYPNVYTKRSINIHAVRMRSFVLNGYREKKKSNPEDGKKWRFSKTLPRNFSHKADFCVHQKISKDRGNNPLQTAKIAGVCCPPSNSNHFTTKPRRTASQDKNLGRGKNTNDSNQFAHTKDASTVASSRKRPASKSPLINTPSEKTSRLRPESIKIRNPAFKSNKIHFEREVIQRSKPCDKKSSTDNNNFTTRFVSQDLSSKAVILTLGEKSLPWLSYDNIRLPNNEKGGKNILGKGVFGFVSRGKLILDGRSHDVVAKIFKPSRSGRQDVLNEAMALHYLASTKAVPKFFGLIEDKRLSKLPVIVQECFADGQDFYKSIDNETAPKTVWVKAFMNAASGLAKIHKDNVILNDIKPDNILMSSYGDVRYIDMGQATMNQGMRHIVVPSLKECDQLSPETRRGEETTKLSDIYSFGMMLQDVAGEIDFQDLFHLGEPLIKEEPSQRATLQDVYEKLRELQNRLSCNS